MGHVAWLRSWPRLPPPSPEELKISPVVCRWLGSSLPCSIDLYLCFLIPPSAGVMRKEVGMPIGVERAKEGSCDWLGNAGGL